MKAVVYLNKSCCAKRRAGFEMEARAFAARRGYSVARTVIESDSDVLPWLLVKIKQLQVAAIVTPGLDHLGHRAQVVLDRCDLLIVHPAGYLPRGTRLALLAPGGTA
ncbi:hypothetical protein [Nocardia cyriacigeorgica]|uniref:Resolvase/invertase-type recombinase catalytic domain-containing protein n=1 Tax=Nocardia cyriacigeorgica TaxID=135487 RepID=A0A5R8NBV1_9NOCA|nr:hypothetical protein [Nocardia cyriacigeorgica]TLF73148.1 hypothetical protein FEK34_26735 [Nocardia cyriacigeorgica]